MYYAVLQFNADAWGPLIILEPNRMLNGQADASSPETQELEQDQWDCDPSRWERVFFAFSMSSVFFIRK